MATSHSSSRRRRVGIVGFGKLGQFLVEAILTESVASERLELAFVWNRTKDTVLGDPRVPADAVLEDLSEFAGRKADLIIEVAHPNITKQYGAAFLASGADYMCGSPTAFADPDLERFAADQAGRTGATTGSGRASGGLYIPSGALWGARDIQKMAQRGTLTGLRVTMRWHPSALRLRGSLLDKLAELRELPDFAAAQHLLYDGPVRALCPMAPNNVNTIACAAMATGSALGFDRTVGRIFVDASLEAHVIEIDVDGPLKHAGQRFTVATRRTNPAKPGAVTGSATYTSFLSSMVCAGGRGPGLHFC